MASWSFVVCGLEVPDVSLGCQTPKQLKKEKPVLRQLLVLQSHVREGMYSIPIVNDSGKSDLTQLTTTISGALAIDKPPACFPLGKHLLDISIFNTFFHYFNNFAQCAMVQDLKLRFNITHVGNVGPKVTTWRGVTWPRDSLLPGGRGREPRERRERSRKGRGLNTPQ
jgi:hypothetical protein